MKNKSLSEMTDTEKKEYIEGISAWRDAICELPDGTTIRKVNDPIWY